MSPPIDLSVLGEVYGAALSPELWPNVLQKVAAHARCDEVVLHFHELDSASCSAYYAELQSANSSARRRPPNRSHAARATMYFELFRDDSVAASIGASRSRDQSRMRAERILRSLLPHLRRALGLTMRILRVQQRLRRAAYVLGRLPDVPTVVRDDSRKMLHANRPAQRLARRPHGVTSRGPQSRSVGVAVSQSSGDRSKAPSPSLDVEEETLRELFGLTVTEARVASALTTGLRVAQAAQSLGVSVATFRWHLRHVFAKTQTRGQSQLVSVLLSGVGPIDRA